MKKRGLKNIFWHSVGLFIVTAVTINFLVKIIPGFFGGQVSKDVNFANTYFSLLFGWVTYMWIWWLMLGGKKSAEGKK